MMGLATTCDRLGFADRAEAAYLELSARSRLEYVQPAVLAATAEFAGRRAEALAWLRRAVEIRDPVLSAYALTRRGSGSCGRRPSTGTSSGA